MDAAETISMEGHLYKGRDVIEKIHDFYNDYRGERLVILPSLNQKAPGLFDKCYKNLDNSDLIGSSQIHHGGKIRILTDVLNAPDWDVIMDFSQCDDVEIRHIHHLDTFLFIHLGQQHAFGVYPFFSYDDFNRDTQVFVVEPDCEQLKSFFESLWEKAEVISKEKVESLFELAQCDKTHIDKNLLDHTYFLLIKKLDRFSNLDYKTIYRSAFSGPLKIGGQNLSFAYIVGVKIPEDASQVVVCYVDKELDCIEYGQSFKVFGKNVINEKDGIMDLY